MLKFLVAIFWCASAQALTVDDVLTRDARADVIVYLQPTAALEAAPAIQDRVARIRYVYDRLRETARVSQASLVAQLNARGLRYRSFYIENAVLIPQASRETVRWLEKRAEVRGDRNHRHQVPRAVCFVPDRFQHAGA